MWRRAVKIGISRGNDFVNSVPFIIEEKKYQSLLEHLLFLNFFSYYYSPFILCLFPWKKKNLFFIFPFRFFFIVFYVLGQVQQQPNYIAGGEETGPKERDRSSPRFPLMVVIIITPTSECMGSSFSSSRKKEKKNFFFFFFPLLFCQFAHLLCSE